MPLSGDVIMPFECRAISVATGLIVEGTLLHKETADDAVEYAVHLTYLYPNPDFVVRIYPTASVSSVELDRMHEQARVRGVHLTVD